MESMEKYYALKQVISDAEERIDKLKKEIYQDIKNYIKEKGGKVTEDELCSYINCTPRLLVHMSFWGNFSWDSQGYGCIEKHFIDLESPVRKVITKKCDVRYWGLKNKKELL